MPDDLRSSTLSEFLVMLAAGVLAGFITYAYGRTIGPQIDRVLGGGTNGGTA